MYHSHLANLYLEVIDITSKRERVVCKDDTTLRYSIRKVTSVSDTNEQYKTHLDNDARC